MAGCGFGVGLFGVLLSWSLRFGTAAYAALVVSQAVWWIPVSVVAGRCRPRSPLCWVLAVSATWTLAEAARSRWPLGGYEWGQLGYLTHDLPLRSAAGLVGTLGLTALLAVACATVMVAVTGPSRRTDAGRWYPLAAVTATMVVLALAGTRGWTQPAGDLTVGVVQVDPVCPGVALVDCPDERAGLLERFAAGTAEVQGEPDLLVWGEGALRGTPAEASADAFGRIGPLPFPLLAGVVTPAGPRRFSNRNVLFGRDGSVLGGYAKRHPVPFGEFVPARRLLGGIGDVGRLVPSDMVAGDRPGRLEVDGRALGTRVVVGAVLRARRAGGRPGRRRRDHAHEPVVVRALGGV